MRWTPVILVGGLLLGHAKPSAARPHDDAARDARAVTYRTETHAHTNMKFEVPSDWATKPTGNVLTVISPTPGVGLEFVAATGATEAKNDEKAMLEAVGRTLQNAKFTSGLKPVAQHGLKGFVANGTGQKNGAEVSWFTMSLGDGKGHVLLAIGFVSPSATPLYREELRHVLDSIQPAK